MSGRGYKPIEAKKNSYPTDIAAASTDEVVSKDHGITASDSINFAMSVEVSNVVLGSGEEILIELEESSGITSWSKVGDPQGGVLIDDGDGVYCIKLDEGVALEALVLPLFECIRVVVTTGATSSLTVNNIKVMTRL